MKQGQTTSPAECDQWGAVVQRSRCLVVEFAERLSEQSPLVQYAAAMLEFLQRTGNQGTWEARLFDSKRLYHSGSEPAPVV